MARFRPSRLFRRLSSRDTQNTQTEPSPSPPCSPNIYGLPSPQRAPQNPATPPPASKRPGTGPRKSRSLPRLRNKFLAAVAQNQASAEQNREGSGLVEQQRKASLLSQDDDGTGTEEEGKDTRSGSESLAGALSDRRESEKSPDINTTELKLDEVDILRKQPVVVVQQPTPDAGDAVSNEKPQSVHSSKRSDSREADEAIKADNTNDSQSEVTDNARSVSPLTLEKKGTASSTSHIRQPSIVDSSNAHIVKALLGSPTHPHDLPTSQISSIPTNASADSLQIGFREIAAMQHRKIWVKRPGASATLVQIREDDLVDDVRDMILRKYANSLGKTFDAPDMTLSIASRAEHGQQRNERILGPEEEMCQTIDTYYSGGQTVDEALIINVPQRRTPKPSPKVFSHPSYGSYQAMDEYRPLENGNDYFPPMPAFVPTTIPQTTSSHDSRTSAHHHHSVAGVNQGVPQEQQQQHPRSISVLNTGQIPPLPSPGAASRRHHHNRPKYGRQPTSSPTIVTHGGGTAQTNAQQQPQQGSVVVGNPAQLVHRQSTRPRLDSSASEHTRGPPTSIAMPPAMSATAPYAPPLPSPAAPEAPPTKNTSQPPTPNGGPPNLKQQRLKKGRKLTPEGKLSKPRRREGMDPTNPNTAITAGSSAASSMLDGSVPPINVLIVEDNIINLRILEGLMKRLKVRWQTAMNGQIAVDKWKAGGFHLVLMDIQMPVMNGLQATKEIRRLERVNNIGVFGEVERAEKHGGEKTKDSESESEANGESKRDPSADRLQITEGLFKSPIIIVALTASSLQSDRHEALAAGCNDFLTKPVSFVWLERKVKEWGCMQALIDFDGWRRWKEFAANVEAGKTEEEKAKEKAQEEKEKVRAEKMARLHEKQAKAKAEKEKKAEGAAPPSEGVNGGQQANLPQGLRPGAEVLGDANFNANG